MVVGPRNGHHEILEERLFEVHQLHEPEPGGVPEGHFDDRADGEQDSYGNEGVEGNDAEEPQERVAAPETLQPAAAEGDDDLPERQRDDADDHVLPALRPDDEPCIQHGGKEEEQKQRKVGLEHDAGEQGYQQAHHAIAPGREDERAQPRGARHGEEVDDEGDVLRLDDLAHEHVGAFCRDAEDEQQQRDEQKVLFPQGGARFAARGHEQAERQDERKDECSRHGTRMDQPLLLLVEALELELLLAGDALALIDDDFTLLDMVVDGLHGLGHGIAEGLRGLAVQGERGHDQRREQDQHGAAALRGELFGGAQLLREGREHGGHVTDIRYVGAQGFRLCVHVADDDPVLGGQGKAHVAHHALAQAIFKPRQARGEDILLHFGAHPLGEQIRADRRCELFRERSAQGVLRLGRGFLPVDQLEHTEDLLPQRGDFGHAEVEHRGLEHGDLIALDLGRLGVLHRQAAVRDDIAVGHFPGHEHPELHGRLKARQKREHEQGGDQDEEAHAVMVLPEQRPRYPGKLIDAKRGVSRSHHRPVLFVRPEGGVPRRRK